MAKRPKPGKCVHCLRDPVERNWDHVFPESWYPDTTPPNLYKWQIPSCVPCNCELGEIEDEFLVLVALCLDPKIPASRSIVEKALRAMNPEAAISSADRKARASLARRVMEHLLEGPNIPQTGIYPTLGEKWGRAPGQGIAVRIPADSFRRLTEKIVRGIFFLEDKKFIEPPYHILFFALDDAGAQPARELLDRAGVTYTREPGIVVKRAVVPEDGISSIFEIEFWGQFKTHASVTSDAP
jgi:hypothetical protein